MEMEKIPQIKKSIALITFTAIILTVLNALCVCLITTKSGIRRQALKAYHLKDFHSLNDGCLGNGCMKNIGGRII